MTDEPAAAADPTGAKMISEKVFNALLDECIAKADRVASINGGVRERIGHHVEKSNLNARVFTWSKAIARKAGTNTHDALMMLEHAYYQFELVEDRIRRQHALELENVGKSPEGSAADTAEAADEQAAAANAEALSGIKPTTSAADMQREHELKKELRDAQKRIDARDGIKAKADRLIEDMGTVGNA